MIKIQMPNGKKLIVSGGIKVHVAEPITPKQQNDRIIFNRYTLLKQLKEWNMA